MRREAVVRDLGAASGEQAIYNAQGRLKELDRFLTGKFQGAAENSLEEGEEDSET